MIAPLSANTLAKLAGTGCADNVLTQLALAYRGPTLVAPAMNVRMWEHPATQANVALLRERGVGTDRPEQGELAEGETGMGRMSEPEAIYARIRELLGESDALAGKTVLVTAGGHARAARLGALRRQPLVRADGRRAGRGGAAARGGGDAARGEPGRAGAGRRRGRRDADGGGPRARGEGAAAPTSC